MGCICLKNHHTSQLILFVLYIVLSNYFFLSLPSRITRDHHGYKPLTSFSSLSCFPCLFMAHLQSQGGNHLFQTQPHLTALLSAVAAAVSLVACGLCNWECAAVCRQTRKNNKGVLKTKALFMTAVIAWGYAKTTESTARNI